jgi:hypothetical protein
MPAAHRPAICLNGTAAVHHGMSATMRPHGVKLCHHGNNLNASSRTHIPRTETSFIPPHGDTSEVERGATFHLNDQPAASRIYYICIYHAAMHHMTIIIDASRLLWWSTYISQERATMLQSTQSCPANRCSTNMTKDLKVQKPHCHNGLHPLPHVQNC